MEENFFTDEWMADLNYKLDSARQAIADWVDLIPVKLAPKFGVFLENSENFCLIPMNCYDNAHRLGMIKWSMDARILVDASYRDQKRVALSCIQDADAEYFKCGMSFVVEICVGYQTAYGSRVAVQNFQIDQDFIKNMQRMTFLNDTAIMESVVGFVRSISSNLDKIIFNFVYDLVQNSYGPEASWIIYKGHHASLKFRQTEKDLKELNKECIKIANIKFEIKAIAKALYETKQFLSRSKTIENIRLRIEKLTAD